MSEQPLPEDCPLREGGECRPSTTRWSEFLRVLPGILAVVTLIVGLAISFQQARIDAANTVQNETIQKAYLSKEAYQKDEATRLEQRQELQRWMERVENKLDRALAKK